MWFIGDCLGFVWEVVVRGPGTILGRIAVWNLRRIMSQPLWWP